jgi:hypothetical protein
MHQVNFMMDDNLLNKPFFMLVSLCFLSVNYQNYLLKKC